MQKTCSVCGKIHDFNKVCKRPSRKHNTEVGYYPTSYTNISGKKVWWKCDKGHSFQVFIQ